MPEERQQHTVPKADQSELLPAESKARKGYGAVMPINRPEDWQAVRREFEELVAEEIAREDSR